MRIVKIKLLKSSYPMSKRRKFLEQVAFYKRGLMAGITSSLVRPRFLLQAASIQTPEQASVYMYFVSLSHDSSNQLTCIVQYFDTRKQRVFNQVPVRRAPIRRGFFRGSNFLKLPSSNFFLCLDKLLLDL